MLSSGFKRTRAQGAEQGETPTVNRALAPDPVMHRPLSEETPKFADLSRKIQSEEKMPQRSRNSQYVATQRKCRKARPSGQFENTLGSLSGLDSISSEKQIEHLRVWLLFGRLGSSVLSLRRVMGAPGPDPFLASARPTLPPAVWKDG
ncbi:hypothetical protein DPX16_16595 [Anabarilius grahami]|uniref:Uncharacterized protein n=1 Tax=Anabarilius grahami TaxID=495550 RepID=A0A3N0XX53_ANAGA|nr:hypothetical protein DPX16_16595 [Anabarilius grahami]